MLTLANKIRAALPPTAPKRRKAARLEVESLEDRAVPTVAFEPQLGNPTVIWRPTGATITTPQTSNATALNNETVHLIFWGPDWVDSSGNQVAAVGTMEKEAQAIVNDNFYSGLSDYGSNGQVTLGAPTVVGSALPASPNPETEIQNLLQQSAFSTWRPSAGGSVLNSPIYVVVMDNVASGSSGWNHSNAFFTPPGGGAKQPINSVYIGLNSVNNTDGFSDLFSHELAERMSDGTSNGIGVTAPAAAQFLPASVYQPNGQVSDNEPDNGNYTYRLGGTVQVQAYWSLSTKEFVIPDGDAGHLYDLTPSWSKVGQSGQTFNNTFTLTINPSAGDTVTFSETKDANGNNVVNVNWNGHTDTFDSDVDKLTGITVNVTRGNVNVNVQSSLADVPVTLNVNDSASAANRSVNVSNNAVTVGDASGLSPITVSYSGHLANLKVVGGSGNDNFQVDSTAAGTQTAIATGIGTNSVFVGASGMSSQGYQDYTSGWTALQKQYNILVRHSLANVAGPVNVQANASGKTSLTVDDSGEAGRGVSVSNNAVSFSGVGAVSYSGISSLNVVAGTENPYVYVGSVPPGVPVTVYHAASSQVWGPAASQVQVQSALPSWDPTTLVPYYSYVPQYIIQPTPDPYTVYNPSVQQSYVAQTSVLPSLVSTSTSGLGSFAPTRSYSTAGLFQSGM